MCVYLINLALMKKNGEGDRQRQAQNEIWRKSGGWETRESKKAWALRVERFCS